MSCFHPLPAFVDRGGGQPRIGYHAGEQGDKLELPCGHCVGCKQDRARSWSIRIMHEAQLYDSNLFVTLDYSPECLPKSLSLEYPHFQGFMKRLRKEMHGVGSSPVGTRPIRFFVAGEYGERFGRPHWHAILFNCFFKDEVAFCNGTYRSVTAQRLWNMGQVVIGRVTPYSAAYVAGYTMNKVYGERARTHYTCVDGATGEVVERRPEFCVMSRRPGIGAWWYAKYWRDLFPHDIAVQDGKTYKVPRFYWEKYRAAADGNAVEEVLDVRYDRSKAIPLSERTERRRRDREECTAARLQLFATRGL